MVNDERVGVPASVPWILLAAIGAALLVTNLMRTRSEAPIASFPARANDMPVASDPDDITDQACDDGRDIAVSGWFQAPFAMSCPAPMWPVVPVLEGNCAIDFTWLMAEPESIIRIRPDGAEGGPPSGPAIHPVFDGPSTGWARPLPPEGDAVPTPVVLIGHFDDARTAGCRPENRQRCLDRFVVTVVAWADGVDFP